MYVYVKNWKIRLKSETRIRVPGSTEYETNHKMTDRLIYEGWQVKIYEESKQYGEDINRYHLQKELVKKTKDNEQLRSIAYERIAKEMELEVKKQEPGAYHKNLYLLKQMRWSQHSWWQENG